MGHPDGAHVHGPNGGGGLIAALVILGIAVAVLHAIWRQLVEVVEIVALVLVSAAGLAVAAGAVYAAVRIRGRVLDARARRTIPARAQVIQLGAGPARVNGQPPPIVNGQCPREAIEAPRRRPAAWPLSSWDEIRTGRGGRENR